MYTHILHVYNINGMGYTGFFWLFFTFLLRLNQIGFSKELVFKVGRVGNKTNPYDTFTVYISISAVLILYLTTQLRFSDDNATAIYHTFTMLCYFLPLLGAIIADSCLGKYR